MLKHILLQFFLLLFFSSSMFLGLQAQERAKVKLELFPQDLSIYVADPSYKLTDWALLGLPNGNGEYELPFAVSRNLKEIKLRINATPSDKLSQKNILEKNYNPYYRTKDISLSTKEVQSGKDFGRIRIYPKSKFFYLYVPYFLKLYLYQIIGLCIFLVPFLRFLYKKIAISSQGGRFFNQIDKDNYKNMSKTKAFLKKSWDRIKIKKVYNYVKIDDVGQGAMGSICKVFDGGYSEKNVFVLKYISPDQLAATESDRENINASDSDSTPKPSSVDRFRREAHIMESLIHPNLILIQRFKELGNNDQYILMEYLPNGDFENQLKKKGTLTFRETHKFFKEVSAGLNHAHNGTVLHRDLKPANILIGKNGQYVVADFGLATSNHNSKEITQFGSFQGTLSHASPEQIACKQKLTPAVDQYALASILVQCLTGSSFLPEDILRGGFPRIYGYRTSEDSDKRSILDRFPKMRNEIAAVIDRMTRINPEDRFPSVLEAFEAFDKVYKKMSEEEKNSYLDNSKNEIVATESDI